MFYNCWCNVHLKCKIQNSTQSSKTTETTMYVHNRVYKLLFVLLKAIYMDMVKVLTLVLPCYKSVY